MPLLSGQVVPRAHHDCLPRCLPFGPFLFHFTPHPRHPDSSASSFPTSCSLPPKFPKAPSSLPHIELELQGRAKTLYQNYVLNVLKDRSSQTVRGPRLQELGVWGFWRRLEWCSLGDERPSRAEPMVPSCHPPAGLEAKRPETTRPRTGALRMDPKGDSPFFGKGEVCSCWCEPAAPTSGYCSDFRGSRATPGPSRALRPRRKPRNRPGL